MVTKELWLAEPQPQERWLAEQLEQRRQEEDRAKNSGLNPC